MREVFIRVNQNLAPDHMAEAFDASVIRSLREEIDRITDYYGSRDGSFFVVEQTTGIIGFYGLKSAGPGVMELRRMDVDPSHHGRGIGGALLAHAEAQARRLGKARLILSTSELQVAALSLYRAPGYRDSEMGSWKAKVTRRSAPGCAGFVSKNLYNGCSTNDCLPLFPTGTAVSPCDAFGSAAPSGKTDAERQLSARYLPQG